MKQSECASCELESAGVSVWSQWDHVWEDSDVEEKSSFWDLVFFLGSTILNGNVACANGNGSESGVEVCPSWSPSPFREIGVYPLSSEVSLGKVL